MQVTEVIVPYRSRNHWSLFVFRRDKVYHLDSNNGIHDCNREERDFLIFVHTAWLESVGAEVVAAEDLQFHVLDVAQQVGGTVCGFAMARYLRLWLQVCTALDVLLLFWCYVLVLCVMFWCYMFSFWRCISVLVLSGNGYTVGMYEISMQN